MIPALIGKRIHHDLRETLSRFRSKQIYLRERIDEVAKGLDEVA